MCKRVAAFGIIFALMGTLPVLADTITIGATNSPNLFPFGVGSGEGNAYFGPYQQIYAAGAFSGPFTVTSIGFRTLGSPNRLTSSFTLSLGTTATTPATPVINYAANRGSDLTPVFSGAIAVPLTGTGGFDFVIPLAVPFAYEPARGNLLLDVFINRNSRGPIAFAAGDTPATGRVYNLNGTGAPNATPNFGLLTQFSNTLASPVPEPATLSLLGGGFTALYLRRRRQARR